MATKPKKLDLSGLRNKTGLSGVQAGADQDKIIMLHPDEIEAPKQVRVTFKRIKELRETIDAEEQQSPIIVGPRKANGKHELYKGGRRHLAAQIEPVIKLKAIVDTRDYSKIPHEKILSQMVENIAREDLLPHEIGRGYLEARMEAEAVGQKLTNVAIAKRTGMSETYVSQHISLATIPDSLAQLIEDGITKDIDLLNSLRVLHGADPDTYEAIIQRALKGEPLDRAEVREANRIAKGGATPGAGDSSPPSSAGEGAQPPVTDGATLKERAEPASVGDEEPAPNAEKHSHAKDFINEESDDETTADHPISNSDDQGVSKSSSRRYQAVSPADIIIFITVANDKDMASGQLITDRVATDPSKAWVSVLNERGEAQAKLVDVDCIQVVSISART